MDRGLRKYATFLKDFQNRSVGYLYIIIPQKMLSHIPWNIDTIPLFILDTTSIKSLGTAKLTVCFILTF